MPTSDEPAGSRRALPPAADRGKLRIDPRVVQKIAAAAASEVDYVGGAARRMLNVTVGSDGSPSQPRVHARVDGTVVTLRLLCSVAYPAPVATVTERLRAHLFERIDAMTGLQTRQVDITVSALTDESAASSSRSLK